MLYPFGLFLDWFISPENTLKDYAQVARVVAQVVMG
jgi:hypothetical protein